MSQPDLVRLEISDETGVVLKKIEEEYSGNIFELQKTVAKAKQLCNEYLTQLIQSSNDINCDEEFDDPDQDLDYENSEDATDGKQEVQEHDKRKCKDKEQCKEVKKTKTMF